MTALEVTTKLDCFGLALEVPALDPRLRALPPALGVLRLTGVLLVPALSTGNEVGKSVECGPDPMGTVAAIEVGVVPPSKWSSE